MKTNFKLSARLMSIVLCLALVLSFIPLSALSVSAEDAVYGLCTYENNEYKFYSCDNTGVSTDKEVDPETITDLFVDVSYFDNFIVEDRTVLNSVKFLSGVKEIYDYAFYGFTNLVSVDFGDTVEYIGNKAFYQAAVTAVTLPASLTYFASNALYECRKLGTIVNSSSMDVTVNFNGEVTIPAGDTWNRSAEISSTKFYIPCSTEFSVQLTTAGTSGTVKWEESDGSPLPDGFEISEDGVLSGTAPVTEKGETLYFDVTSDNGEDIKRNAVDLTFYIPEKYNTVLADSGVKLTSGKTGEGAATERKDYVITLEPSNPDNIIFVESVKTSDDNDLTYSFQNGKFIIPHYELDDLGENTEITVCTLELEPAEKVLSSAETLTLPLDTTLTLNSTGLSFYTEDEFFFFTKVYKTELKAGETLDIAFYNSNEYCDTYFELYTMENGELEEADYQDKDNAGAPDEYGYAYGEQGSFTAEKDGTHYLFLMTYADSRDIPCTLKIEKSAIAFISGSLDFTDDETKASGDKYSWDKTSKTLTLKDGFAINSEDDCAIILPDGSKVIIEGKALIQGGYDGICANDGENLDIELKAGAELTVDVSDNGIDLGGGKLTITGNADSDGKLPKLNIESYDSAIVAGSATYDDEAQKYNAVNGEIEIRNCELDLFSDDSTIVANDGSISLIGCTGTVESNENDDESAILIKNVEYYYNGYFEGTDVYNKDYTVTLTDCTLRLLADDETVYSYHGGITFKDCDLYIYSDEEEGVHATGVGDITVSGGRLIVISSENCLESDSGMVNLSNVNLMLESTDEAGEYAIIRNDGEDIDLSKFSIPGKFKLLDYDGNVLYEGEWKPELLDTNGWLTVDGEMPYALISVLEEGKKEDITADLVTGIKAEYTKGDKISFAVAAVPEYPVQDTVGFAPYKWEIEGTGLSGKWSKTEDFSAYIATADLAVGTYTLKVIYAKSVFDIDNAWTAKQKDNNELEETVTVEKTFTVKASSTGGNTDNAKDSGNLVSPKTGDNGNIWLLVAGLLISGMGIFIAKRRKNIID